MSTVKRHSIEPIARQSIPDAIKHVYLKADGTPRDLTGYTVVAYLERPDGTEFPGRPAEIVDAAEGSVRYLFQPGDLAVADQAQGGTAKVGTTVQFVASNDTTGRRHISDIAVIGVGDTPVSSEYDTP